MDGVVGSKQQLFSMVFGYVENRTKGGTNFPDL